MSSEHARSPTPVATTASSTSLGTSTSSGTSSAVQLKRSLAGKDFEVQQKALEPTQRKADGVGEHGDAGNVHAAAERGVQGGGGALPHQAAIQKSFGRHDVSGIKGHVGGPATEATQAMGAKAYATGDHVAFGGEPDLHTAAHEAAHVVQQRGGVQLAGGVGKEGDPYERHADQVADKVVAGQSAEGLLDTMAGGPQVQRRESRGVQRRAVQREALSRGTIDSGQESAVTTRASERGGTTSTGDMVVRGTNHGEALVASGASSMAENPHFERDAAAFERQLGVSAYSRGNGPAGEMAQKAKAYLMEKTGATQWKASEARLAEEVKKLGSDKGSWSGTVGLAVDDLLAVFDSGNVATRMCHLENFWGMLSNDIKLNDSMIDEMIENAGILAADLAKFRDDRGANPFHVPSGSEVEGQGSTRLQNPDRSAHRTPMTVGSVGVPLDPAEAEVQVPGYDRSSGPPPQAAILQWEEGARIWMMNERNKWVHLMRQLSIPLAAGPSGTTNKLMNLGQVLGMDPFQTRLACMGYLLPAKHHSLCEIMEAAAPHGANDFIRGRRMYTRINPWSESELKAFGGGKFPHETHGDDPVSVPQP